VVSWSPPVSNGGNAITSYMVTSVPASRACHTELLSCAVSGLIKGVPYVFSVVARNANGDGVTVASTTAITPMAVPGAPIDVLATAGDASATVSWTAPTSDCGGAITSYSVTASPGGANCVVTGATSCVVPGLTNYQNYTFTVTALNATGRGARSKPSGTIMPLASLGEATAVAVRVSRSSARVSWTAPAAVTALGLVVTYSVSATVYRLAGWTTQIVDGVSVDTAVYTVTTRSVCSAEPALGPAGRFVTATACSAGDLVNGTSYLFSVTASVLGYTSSTTSPSPAYTPTGVPGRPTNVTAVTRAGAATVTWRAPIDDGGYPISGYTVTARPVSGCATGATCPIRYCVTDSTTCTLTSVQAGVSYQFTVIASNREGSSEVSATSEAVQVPTVPGAPTGVTVTPENGAVLVSWSAPSSNGGLEISSYLVMASGTWRTCAALGGSATASCRIMGLTTGQSYTFSVVAINEVGTGASSTASSAVTAMVAPSAPLDVSGAWGNGSVVVSWSAPSSNGGGALTYTVSGYYTVDGGVSTTTLSGLCSAITARTCEVPTPIAAEYYLRVTAANATGAGPSSGALHRSRANVVPDAPTSVSVTPGILAAKVSWSQSFNGGPAISTYRVSSRSSNDSTVHSCSTGGLTCTVSGLLAGVSYTFTVSALNSYGYSPDSIPSSSVTISGEPSAPLNPKAIVGMRSAYISWTAPTSNGGSVITSYIVTARVADGSVSKTFTCTATSTLWCIVTGLSAGVSYSYTVRALNASSPATSASAPVASGSFTELSSFAIGAYSFSADTMSFDETGRLTGTGSITVETLIIPVSYVYADASNWSITATSATRLFGTTPVISGLFSSSTSGGTTVTVNRIVLTVSNVTLGGYFGLTGVFNINNSTGGASLSFVGSATVAGYTLKTVTLSSFTPDRVGFKAVIITAFFTARLEGMVYLTTPAEEYGYTITDVFGTEQPATAGDFYLAATDVQIGFASFTVTGEVMTGRSGGSNWFGFQTRVKLGNGAAARSIAVVAAFGTNGDFKLGGGGTVLMAGVPVDVLLSYQSAAGGSTIHIEGVIKLYQNTELALIGEFGWGVNGVSIVLTAQMNFNIAGFQFGSASLTVAVTPVRQSISITGTFDVHVFRSSYTATFGVHNGDVYLRFTMEMNFSIGVAGANGSITVTNCDDSDCTSIRDWTDISVLLDGKLDALGRQFSFTQSLPVGFTFSFTRSYSFSTSSGSGPFSFGASGTFDIYLSSGRPWFSLSASLNLWASLDLGLLGRINVSIGGGIDTDRGIWVSIEGTRYTLIPFR
jgi:hypothetical protein